MTNKVTVPRARGIKCPYTGKEIDVFLTVGNGAVLYSCPGAFTLREPVGSLAELQDRASMRNGMHGAADGARRPVCAYTGQKLLLRELPGGRYFYAGGFNPRQAYRNLDELLYFLTMRNGVPARQVPGPIMPVEGVREPPPARPDARIEPSDATLEAMEKLASEHMDRGTMVSMSVPSGKSAGKSAGSRASNGGK